MRCAIKLFLAASLCSFGWCVAPYGDAKPVETTLKDSQGLPAWLYTPTAEPDPKKTYWLVVGVHGLNKQGKNAIGISSWAEADDVIVLGPTFKDGYQGANGDHEEKFKKLVGDVGKKWKLQPRLFLHGFSAGAQFSHRYAFRNPKLVAGVSAHSAGSWEPPNPAARHIPFAISCGESDTKKAAPDFRLNRIDWFREFSAALKAERFDVTAKTWPGVAHKRTPEVEKMAKELFEKVRKSAVMK